MGSNMNVYIKTMFGDIIVDGRIESNFLEYIDKLDERSSFENIQCSLFVLTQIAGNPKPQKREINLDYVTYLDLKSIKKANEESDERHQVDMSTLAIWRVNIDGEKLRIEWTFDDGNGRRIICGNPNEILQGDKCERKMWHVMPLLKFQVAW